MKSSEVIKQLADKEFQIFVCGTYQQSQDFLGALHCLNSNSDFAHITKREQARELKILLNEGKIRVSHYTEIRIKKDKN